MHRAGNIPESPGSYITEKNIHVYDGYVTVKIPNRTISWGLIADTGSMRPILDGGHHTIEIVPNKEDIDVGDIISYKSEYGTIIHRVVKVHNDTQGAYYETKGDNNKMTDPWTVRFENVTGLVVGIIY